MRTGVKPVPPGKRTKGREKTPRKSPDPQPRKTLFTVRGRPEWHAWLKRLADHDRSSAVEVLDRAAARYAKEVGFTEPPPER